MTSHESEIEKGVPKLAWETPRGRRGAPYTTPWSVARGPKTAMMTLSMFSNDP